MIFFAEKTRTRLEHSFVKFIVRGIGLKTNYILIDYENVQVKSLALLKGGQFRVRVFLGPNNTKLPIEFVIAMQELGDCAEYIVLETPGDNALDFHIAYYLGILATSDPTGYFHIITKDKGFDPLIRHLKNKKIFSSRSESIEDMPCFKATEDNVNSSNTQLVEIKKKNTSSKKLMEDLIKVAVNDLIKRKASKPRTPKTLLSTIHAKCGKDVPISDIENVFKRLVEHGYIKVNGPKVTYALPTAQI